MMTKIVLFVILILVSCIETLRSQSLYTNSTGVTVTAPNTAIYIASELTTGTGTTPLIAATVSFSANFISGQDYLGVDGAANGISGGIQYSFNSVSGVLSLTGSASAAEYETLLRKVTYTNTSSTPGTGNRIITFSLNAALPYSGTGHFYEFVSSESITWTNAKTAAAARSYFGLKGYLVTITSSGENDFAVGKLSGQGWIGASDAATEGTWKWETGPEAGTQFWSGLYPSAGGLAVNGNYNKWADGEPNNSGDEDYAHFLTTGYWNDYPNSVGTSIKGYVVEYGGMDGDPVLHISDNADVAIEYIPVLSTNGSTITAIHPNTDYYIASALTISASSSPFTAATVSITGNFVSSEDVLQINGSASGTDGAISYSFNSATGVMELEGTGTSAQYEAILRKVTYRNLSQDPSAGDRKVTFSLNPALPFAGNGHYYEFISSGGISWTNARDAAASRKYFGLQGYLATITSAEENAFCAEKLLGIGWIGASDAASEGDWKWVTGPEAGTSFWSGAISGSAVDGMYTNWGPNQPDNFNGTEDYAHFQSAATWNDLPVSEPSIAGYVVEYGGMTGDPELNISDEATVSISYSYPAAPTGITGTNTICSGSSVQLTATGAAGTVYWYTGSCGGTLVTTGNPVTVTPAVNTTYYARCFDGYLFSTGCARIDITVDQHSSGGTISDTPSIIYGASTGTMNLSGYTGTIQHWEKKLNTESWTGIDNVSDTYSEYPLAAGIWSYRVAVKNGVCPEAYSSETYVTVDKASLIVTANDKVKTYGAEDPVLDYTVTGDLYFDDTYSVMTGVNLEAPEGVLATAGIHTIAASGGSAANYNVTHVNGTLTVSKADLTATADDKSRIYGEANPALTVSYSGFAYNDDISSVDIAPAPAVTADATSDAGTYPITLSPGSDDNYDITNIDATLTIGKAGLTVTADDKDKVYGEVIPELTVSYSGFVNGDDRDDLDIRPVASTTAGDFSDAGSYTISVSGGSDNNYDFTYNPASLTISKAPLVATADDRSKTYGETNPELTVSFSGFVNDDDASVLDVPPVPSTEATVSSYAGAYTVMLSPGSDNNYEITTIDGELTIDKAALSVIADDKTKIYGEANPELTVSFSGFVNDDDPDDIDSEPSASTSAGLSSDAGIYEILVDGGSDNNYSFDYHRGTLRIEKADQLITFHPVPSGLRTTENFQLTATSSSGMPVSFESSDNAVADIIGNEMTVLREGNVTITAVQAGNKNYNPAPDVAQTIETLPAFDNIMSLFTPNNDGMNDTWYIPDIEQYGTVQVKVYNRFGKLVYESSAYNNDWDGTYNGKPLPEASYYYIIKAENRDSIIKGVVNIVR